MPYRDPEALHWIKAIGYILIAFIGGVLGYMIRSMNNKEKVDRNRLFVEGCASAFVGMLVMMLCQEINVSPQITGMAVGVFGWLGASVSIALLERWLYSRLGISKERNKPSQPPE